MDRLPGPMVIKTSTCVLQTQLTSLQSPNHDSRRKLLFQFRPLDLDARFFGSRGRIVVQKLQFFEIIYERMPLHNGNLDWNRLLYVHIVCSLISIPLISCTSDIHIVHCVV